MSCVSVVLPKLRPANLLAPRYTGAVAVSGRARLYFGILVAGGICAAQTNPGEASAKYGQAIARFREGRFAEARTLLEKAATNAPQSGDVWKLLGLTNLRLNDYSAAAAPLRRACDLGSGEDSCYLAGRTLFLLTRYD